MKEGSRLTIRYPLNLYLVNNVEFIWGLKYLIWTLFYIVFMGEIRQSLIENNLKNMDISFIHDHAKL